ncbi:XdhC family protein [Undibacterium cyanobacteriorum]|uniref:XdhC family protein n=1 Tax=Undibacterium cyanobacteriorum TaxID=3073561 RepID=A0ABY9RP31_9BURK|nr:XdhC family protein [Undibacterium sp. 20NA77.5]WMW82534.1 XdhC family protein [Undibacterium sp. 20NA77.5]
MESVDLEVLRTCATWLEQGKRCELVTVVKTWGSSPRPEGSMLALGEGGLVVGSISGGCIEDDLIAQVQEHGFRRQVPELLTYGVSADQAHRFGLPCGGTIQLLIEPLSERSRIADLLFMLREHRLVQRSLELANGAVSLIQVARDRGLSLSDTHLNTAHGPRWRLLVIGAGQMSRFLASIAVGLDFEVTVCDPREEYHETWPLDGVRLSREMPDDIVMSMQLDQRSAVVALTHDPKLDDLAIMEALKSEAFFVGAIGSRINNAKRRERLALFDLNEEQISRLKGPVGIYIGSKTPPEIAVSIMAEIIAVKNGVKIPKEIEVGFVKEQEKGSNGSS